MRKKLVASFLILLLVLSFSINSFMAENVYGSSSGTINVSYDKNTNIICVSGTTIDKSSKLSMLVSRLNDGFRAQIDAAVSDNNGNYSFSFPLNNGEYKIIVNSPNERLIIEKFVWPVPNGDTIPSEPEHGNNSHGNNSPGPGPGVQPPGTNTVSVSAPILNALTGEAKVTISNSALDTALAAAVQNSEGIKEIIIPVAAVQGADAYKVSLPSNYLTKSTENPSSEIQIQTALGNITVPDNMLTATGLANSGQDVGISLGLADSSSIPESLKTQIGGKPVFDINLEVNGVKKIWSNPNAPVTVSVNYTPTAEELSNPDNIVIWYLDEATNTPVPIPNCKYDPLTGKVTFTATHFSKYAIAYVKPNLTDIDGYSWANKEINAVVVKGIVKAAAANTYNPKGNVTRAEFMYGLVRSLGLSAKFNDSFTDVIPSDYYYNEIGTAKALGIAEGQGNNKFNPASPITRQDVMVLTARALIKAGKLNTSVSADLSKFADSKDIAGYARESIARIVADGIILGSGNKINPHGMTNRAEAAVIFYRILKK